MVTSVTLLLASCGSDVGSGTDPDTGGGSLSGTTTTDPSGIEDGFGPQAALPGEFERPWSIEMFGTLEQDEDGCWALRGSFGDGLFVVLPHGFTDDPSENAVVATDGTVIAAGSAVGVTGATIDVDELPGRASGRWAERIAYCEPTDRAAVVTDTVTLDTYDPSTLDDTALAELVERAEFDVDWDCGFGFATSAADQFVGLLLDPVDFAQPPAGLFTLPDERWRATVVVGEHLFADHCDDVAEMFEPRREVVARYPLIAGTFVFSPPAAAGSAEPVAIVLEGPSSTRHSVRSSSDRSRSTTTRTA